MPSERLVVFVRAPRPGQVKTRLAQALGERAACAAYRELVQTVLGNLSALPDVELHYTPADAAGEIQSWLRPGWSLHPQVPGDLGRRLQAAFQTIFQQGAQRVVVVGSDCPAVTTQDVATAWAALDSADVVLGPACDGGYWLIGLRQAQPALFERVPWGTPAVFQETLERARGAKLTITRLRKLSDVDTLADWEAFLNGEFPGNPSG
ncbi:MAG TPA: TIGR04282 family arsenosugar biosynthesis glycosyltransferase, partial [Bacillota bacterium]|nr:TIGR04282 family arsenosugar biosynthesis glycosyltransferase [Bacillota bacterium]